MYSVVLTAVLLAQLSDTSLSKTDTFQEARGIKVSIESLELSRFSGELVSNIGVAGQLVPKIERAIVLTTSIRGTQHSVAPRIQLANGSMVELKIHGNTLRSGVQGLKSAEGTDEAWFEIDKELALHEIFPCSIIVLAKARDGEWINFNFEGITP